MTGFFIGDNMEHEKYVRRCYELAVSAGKKGFDTFGAVLAEKAKAALNK